MKIKLLMTSAIIFLVVPTGFIFADENSLSIEGEKMSERQAIVEARKAERTAKIEERKTEKEKKIKERMCTRVDKVVNRIEEKISNRENRANERLNNRLDRLETNRSNKDNALANRREAREKAREAMYANLESRAQTSEEKQAIEDFKNIIETAVGVRISSVDKAIKAMRDGVDTAIESRKASLEALLEDFKNLEQTAVDKAKNACNDDITTNELKEILTTLRDDLKSAREKYKAEAQEIRKMEEVVNELRETKKASIQSAFDTFKETVEGMRKELADKLKPELEI